MMPFSSKPRLPQKLASTLLLAGVLVIGAYPAAGQSDLMLHSDQSPAQDSRRAQRPTSVPRSLTARVIRETAREFDVRTSDLRVVEASRETWPDGCLGLGGPAESCLQALVEGWRITVTDDDSTWIYRTDETGQQIRLESPQSDDTAALPSSVQAQVFNAISREFGVRRSDLRVVEASQETWSDGCLGLGGPAESCLRALVEGWRVTVTDDDSTWVYRTDATGQQVRLETSQSDDVAALPSSVRTQILSAVTQESDQPELLSIVSATEETWPDRCLGLPRPTELCAPAQTEGWRVTVTDQAQTWIYRTDATGQTLRLESRTNSATFPNQLRDRVLQAAAEDFDLPVSRLRITESQPRTWDGCLGINPGVGGACTQIAIFGWQVIVTDGEQGRVYHTDSNGSRIVLNERASGISGDLIPTFIPRDSNGSSNVGTGVIFRAERTGGIAGQTQIYTLMSDGRVLLSETATTPVRTIKRLTPQQVRQFEIQLRDARLSDFDHLYYPAPGGAADYFTVTVSTPASVFGYADIVQDQLPPDLQEVVEAGDALVRVR